MITNLRMEFGCNFLKHYCSLTGMMMGRVSGLGHTRTRNSVTTAKLEPAPRSANQRSVSCDAT